MRSKSKYGYARVSQVESWTGELVERNFMKFTFNKTLYINACTPVLTLHTNSIIRFPEDQHYYVRDTLLC